VIEDVVIAGAGPAGLAAAIGAARRGRRVLVFERQAEVPDKACGEGLMPGGTRELGRLGVEVAPEHRMPFLGIRYLQEDGAILEARFRGRTGIGIRRLALQQALRERAIACGARLEHGAVLGYTARTDRVHVETSAGSLLARILVAADGLNSPLRRAAGLQETTASAPRRFGLRRHFRLAPWTDFVEVHWAAGVEAYVTPVSPGTVNVALLRDREGGEGFDSLLSRFPRLRETVGGAPFSSELRGAGPLLQRVRRPFAQRLALVGDAAGYVDAITGQGLSLAFKSAALLMEALPADLSQDLAPALRLYEARLWPHWLAYAIPAQALVALSRRPSLRRAAFRSLATVPGAFAAIVRLVA